MDFENPSLLMRILMKFDPAVFYFIVLFFKYLLLLLDLILDRLFGYTLVHGTKEERHASREYERSAQVVNVYGRGAPSIIINHTLKNFLYTHVEYVHPRYVLQSDRCTLMGMDEDYVIFCVSKVDVYDTKSAPFTFLWHYLTASQLVKMPYTSFNRLAAEVGDPAPDKKYAIINMTARCGSTLLCQMLAHVPRVRVISEPWIFVHMHGLYMRGHFSMCEYRMLLRNAVRLVLKPEHDTEYDHIVIKNTGIYTCGQMPMLKEMYPQMKQLFITRQLKPSIISFKKMLFLQGFYARWSSVLHDFWWHHVCVPYDNVEWWDLYRYYKALDTTKKMTREVTMMIPFTAQLSDYLKTKQNYCKAILFEDLVNNREEETRDILEKLDISVEYVPLAMQGYKKESQRGVFGQMGAANVTLTDEILNKIDEQLKECNSPFSTKMTLEEMRKLIYL